MKDSMKHTRTLTLSPTEEILISPLQMVDGKSIGTQVTACRNDIVVFQQTFHMISPSQIRVVGEDDGLWWLYTEGTLPSNKLGPVVGFSYDSRSFLAHIKSTHRALEHATNIAIGSACSAYETHARADLRLVGV